MIVELRLAILRCYRYSLISTVARFFYSNTSMFFQVEPCFRFDSDYVAPIKLVNFRVKDYEWCVALGWGRRVVNNEISFSSLAQLFAYNARNNLQANVPGSKLLRFTDLIHLSIAECKKRSGFTIPKGFVCAGDLKGRTSICYVKVFLYTTLITK